MGLTPQASRLTAHAVQEDEDDSRRSVFRDRATVAIKICCHRKVRLPQPGNQVGDDFTASSSESLQSDMHRPSEQPLVKEDSPASPDFSNEWKAS